MVEAIFEIRFEMSTIPEVFFGRIVDTGQWQNFQKRNMPAYDMPAQMRTLNPTLRYQPIIELVDAEAPTRAVRFGPQVLSYHRIRRYEGWKHFRVELSQAIDTVFSKSDNLAVSRLGLRYLNALRPNEHRVKGMADLDMSTTIAGAQLHEHMNLNFTRIVSEKLSAGVRIATADLVSGMIPPDTSVYVDVDVFTPEGFRSTTRSAVDSWLDVAHDAAKAEFFHLLKRDTISFLERNAKDA